MSTRTSDADWLDHILYGPEQKAVAELNLPEGEYSIGVPIAHLVGRLIESARIKSVLEFGAGRSSEVLAAALSYSGGRARLTSIEHAPEYSADAWKRVEQAAGVDPLLVIAALEECWTSKGRYYAYPAARDAVAARAPFDLVFVDAPPGQYGRAGTVHEIVDLLSTGALVVLDDCQRYAEQAAMAEWLAAYPHAELVLFHPSYGRGVGILQFGREARTPTRDTDRCG